MTAQRTDDEFENFLLYLSNSRGFDFTSYKRATLARRIDKRMQEVGVTRYPDYTDYLEVHPDEFVHLFNTILINVTSFFRDPPVWEFVAQEVIPRILQERNPEDPIRLWSAGCASGEEAYTLAILFAEALGAEEFSQRVKIYGTDVDDDALAAARHAHYSARDVQAVPDELREKYFEQANHGYVFHRDLRRSVIFGRHDLLADAPISRIDLLACRNTLMYFNAEAQARIVPRFLFGLAPHGYIVLGRAESLLAHSPALVPVDLKLRIFTKAGRPDLRERLIPPAIIGDDAPVRRGDAGRLRDVAFESDPVPQATVDAGGLLVAANARARQLFGINATDIGRPFQDLEISYRPLELRSLINRVHEERRQITVPDVEWRSGPLQRWLSVHLIPLWEDGSTIIGVNIVFTDSSHTKELEAELDQSRNEVETAHEELQSTNEELETTNEELQSTVEELETTNEELQSTNEELETMNEELQSTNEELEALNSDIIARGDELDHTNAFLNTILTSLQVGVVVVRPDFTVDAWNRTAENMWGLRSDEVLASHFLNLDIGLPVDALKQPVRDSLSSGERHDVTLEATNRRGRNIECRVACVPLKKIDEVVGVILLMEETPVFTGEAGSAPD
jgi:two-component system, chemotaxis family, CheB/CheR fusion protein